MPSNDLSYTHLQLFRCFLCSAFSIQWYWDCLPIYRSKIQNISLLLLFSLLNKPITTAFLKTKKRKIELKYMEAYFLHNYLSYFKLLFCISLGCQGAEERATWDDDMKLDLPLRWQFFWSGLYISWVDDWLWTSDLQKQEDGSDKHHEPKLKI